MRRIVLLVVLAGLVATGGVARGDGATYAVAGLPSAATPNGAGLALAPSWLTPPAEPVQLTTDQLLAVWQQAAQAYGVPWNVLAAINKIESNFGRNMGPSSAGAVGWMQFMPSTWLRWGTDADGNGVADPWNPVDAIYSAARYLAASGAGTDIRRAIFSYNHADWYVNQVAQLANLYEAGGVTEDVQPSVSLAQLQAQVAQAQADVTTANEAYQAAEAKAQELAAQERAAADRAAAEPLLSDQLDGQKEAAQLGSDAAAAQAEADRLKAALDKAQRKLAALQGQVEAGSSGEPVVQLSAAPPQWSGAWVFPVGGGPGVVAVSHVHHDYPAADITAPQGSPVYALSDGTVLHAWDWDDRCGIGFTMQTGDGQTWTYCHLSYRYPTVVEGAALRAGDPVGLVGATGDATGPHLHLQLQPAASYPQDQQWFQSFAGTAFQWTDGGQPQAQPDAPRVFRIVPSLD